jgi:hypothetical protein
MSYPCHVSECGGAFDTSDGIDVRAERPKPALCVSLTFGGECGGETNLDECKPRKGHAASHQHTCLKSPRNGVECAILLVGANGVVGGRWMALRSDGRSEAAHGQIA